MKDIPFYRKPIRGPRAQMYLQVGVATSIFLSFVVAPVWYEFLVNYKKRYLIKEDPMIVNQSDYIQRQVYMKRLELRELAQKLIQEEEKNNKK
jgi:hypothetical protein